MSANNYDVIVIGVGSMGSASCYGLANRGYKVLGIDQFDSPHQWGAHAGQSRIIRKAYFEGRDYVPLLKRAYKDWHQLEEQTGEQVFFRTGLLYAGPADHFVMKGLKESASLYDIKLDYLDLREMRTRFPQFIVPGNFEMIFEADAGFITPEKAITLLKREAAKKSAVIHSNEIVLEWKKGTDGITVITDKSTYHSKKLVITAGAWSAKMLHQLGTSLKITRQVVVWLRPPGEGSFSAPDFPCWMLADHKRKGPLYGFPFLPEEKFGKPEGVKFSWHYPGRETDPDKVSRQVDEFETDALIRELAEYIPAFSNTAISAVKTCLYANSPDENFIIDHLPGFDGDVVIACGFSGHGFKFIPVVGEILADLAIKGKTDLPADFLSLKRFQ